MMGIIVGAVLVIGMLLWLAPSTPEEIRQRRAYKRKRRESKIRFFG